VSDEDFNAFLDDIYQTTMPWVTVVFNKALRKLRNVSSSANTYELEHKANDAAFDFLDESWAELRRRLRDGLRDERQRRLGVLPSKSQHRPLNYTSSGTTSVSQESSQEAPKRTALPRCSEKRKLADELQLPSKRHRSERPGQLQPVPDGYVNEEGELEEGSVESQVFECPFWKHSSLKHDCC